MELKVIKSEQEYEIAIERLEQIFYAEPDSPEGDEAEVSSLLIEKYEEENYPIELPDPIEAIKFRMEQLGMKQKETPVGCEPTLVDWMPASSALVRSAMLSFLLLYTTHCNMSQKWLLSGRYDSLNTCFDICIVDA